MIFDITTFTLIHVGLSLIGIIAGLVVAGGLVAGKRLDGWTGVFLVTTVLTNVTGFGFPFVTFLPSHAVGIVSLIVLPIVILARYWKNLAGAWRGVYVVGAVLALYLNVFVLVAQLFLRLPALIVAAPTQTEPPFLVTQLVMLVLFVGLGRAALRGFRAESAAMGGGWADVPRAGAQGTNESLRRTLSAGGSIGLRACLRGSFSRSPMGLAAAALRDTGADPVRALWEQGFDRLETILEKTPAAIDAEWRTHLKASFPEPKVEWAPLTKEGCQ